IAEKKNDPSLARSQAEQFLFRVLELAPETRGVFQLNAKMPFKFGNRSMEVDLFSSSDQIALEIDGYYHFQNSESWRPDRCKVFVLQPHRTLVLRVRACDLLSHLDEIREAVRQAGRHRRKKYTRKPIMVTVDTLTLQELISIRCLACPDNGLTI